MFGITKKHLAEGLDRIQKALCSYTRQPCDCKYGATRPGQGSEEGPGCPEVSMARELIKAMTPFEFARLCKRAHVRVVDDA